MKSTHAIFSVFLSALAGMSVGSSGALALTLPASFIYTQPGPTGVVVTDDSSVSYSYDHGTTSGSLTANVQPAPYIYVEASADAGGYQSTVWGYVNYYFGFSGPAAVEIPIVVNATGQVSPSSQLSNQTEANLLILDFVTGEQIYWNKWDINNASSSISKTLTVLSNTVYSVTVNAYAVASTWLDQLHSDASWAFLDPIISIDPSFAQANLFTLELSEGVGNIAATVPVPAALPLLGGGVALLGLLAQRKRRKAPASSIPGMQLA